jgi:hypothetical protein
MLGRERCRAVERRGDAVIFKRNGTQRGSKIFLIFELYFIILGPKKCDF